MKNHVISVFWSDKLISNFNVFNNIKITLHYSVHMRASGEKVCSSDEAECVQPVSYSYIRSLSGSYTVVLNKLENFAVLIQSKIFFELSSPILIRLTCPNIWSNPVCIRKKLWLSILVQWSMQFGYPYLIRLSLFKIKSNPDPFLKCRIRLDRDPETGPCSTLIYSGVFKGRQARHLPPALLCNCNV